MRFDLLRMAGAVTLAAVWLAGCASDEQTAQESDAIGDTATADSTQADTAIADLGANDDATADTGQGDSAVTDTGQGDSAVTDTGQGDSAVTDTDAGPTLGAPERVTSTYYLADQMLLANEINESGEPFAEALGYDLDALDPMVPGAPDDTAYVLGIENYEYSRYQLGTIISRSGMGLHMMWAPVISQMAAMEGADFDGSLTGTPNGVNEDDELMKNIKMFSQLSNHAPPGHPWPQFAEFVSGDPHLPQAIDADNFAWADFSTLRWDRTKMDKTLNPAAMGQTLMKQYLWAQDMLSGFHNGADEPIDADGTVSPDAAGSPMFDPDNDVYYGGDALDGFIGMVLTAEAVNKIAFIKGKLAYDGAALGAVDPATYDPANGIQYFPHAIAVTETATQEGLPPKATGLSVTDASSQLFDQASLLWGLTSFVNMMDPSDTSDSAHIAYRSVFDGSPFPPAMSESGTPGPYDLMKGVSKVIFLNLRAMHYDADHAVYVDTANLDAGAVTRGQEVSTVASAYLIVSLERFVEEFDGTPLKAMATQAIADQAGFLAAHLANTDGVYYDSVTLDGAGTTRSVDAQAAAVRGLYVAARVTGDEALKTAADAAYAALIATYYDETFEIFRTSPGSDDAVYTPRNVALLSGALREAALEGDAADATAIYVGFFMRVADKMQLSEGANTGETGGDSDGDGVPFIPEQPDGLPPVFASQATFHLTP